MVQRSIHVPGTLLAKGLLAAILFTTAYTYAIETQDMYYRADDYLFLSQVVRHGLLKSLVIPFKGHFLPIYRLLMGGLYLVSANATAIKTIIIAFHLLNIAIIFHLVQRHSRSVLLASLSALALGFSSQAASSVLWSITGIWSISLTFILLMALALEKYLDTLEKSCLPENDAPPPNGLAPPNESLTAQSDIARRPTPSLTYYYLALASFVAALGIFTVALGGGFVLWSFMYLRILRRKTRERIPRLHIKMIVPFASILICYIGLRAYFQNRYFLLQDYLFTTVSSMPPLSFTEKLAVILHLPPHFHRSLAQQMMPYVPNHYAIIICLLVLLFIKELRFRREQAHVILMWLAFSLCTLGFPLASRIFFAVQLYGSALFALSPWYFCYPLAGISIALGLLFRPPPLLEKTIAHLSLTLRGALFVAAAAALIALNVPRAEKIRIQAATFARQDGEFHELVMQYNESMASFLRSSSYSPARQFHFQDAFAATPQKYPSSWSIRQSDLFQLYFPHVKNVTFDMEKKGENPLVWTPRMVIML